jgi:hypothetical protein
MEAEEKKAGIELGEAEFVDTGTVEHEMGGIGDKGRGSTHTFAAQG